MFEYLIDSRIADVVDELERAKPRERVGRLNDDAQKRQRVFDVGRLRKPDPAKLAKRNAVLAKFNLQIERVRAGTKEHGDFTQRHACFAQVRYALSDKPRLLILIARTHHDGRLSTVDARVKPLLIALFYVGNDGVRDV